MKMTKYLKYVVVAVLAGTVAFMPVTEAIAAVSGQETEAQRQERVDAEVAAFYEEATAPVNQTVEGTKSDVSGLYFAKSVKGVALAPSVDSNADKSSYVKVSDTDKNKSSAAVGVANNVAAALNATVGPCINVTYGKKVDGKYVQTADGSKGLMNIGIPANFKSAGAQYSVIAIYEGVLYQVYPNISTNPNSITVNLDQAPSANVMYALIKK